MICTYQRLVDMKKICHVTRKLLTMTPQIENGKTTPLSIPDLYYCARNCRSLILLPQWLRVEGISATLSYYLGEKLQCSRDFWIFGINCKGGDGERPYVDLTRYNTCTAQSSPVQGHPTWGHFTLRSRILRWQATSGNIWQPRHKHIHGQYILIRLHWCQQDNA